VPRFVALAAAAGAVALVTAASSASSAAGTLSLRAALGVTSDPVACPPELPQDGTDCRARVEQARVPGLGAVTATYVWVFRVGPPTCPSILTKPLATTGRLAVAGKGELRFALSDGAGCVDVEPVRNEPQTFTITGGTGLYAGASGSGTVERSVSEGVGTETWTGTLVAPGTEFDVTAPTLTGAASKTVRAPKGAKRARVTYKVTASDAVDGPVPATCAPRSGSRFPIGRTVVKCSAEDSSANIVKASFRVTVKATR
jgi:HYR domain-containing protein